MKTIDLSGPPRDLSDVLNLAAEENVLLTTSDGRQFVVAEIDDFENEVRLVREQKELMDLLAERSSDTKRFTLDEIKRELNLV